MLDPTAQDHEIAAVAQHYANCARSLVASQGRGIRRGPAGFPISMDTPEALAGELDRLALQFGARPVARTASLSGRILRMVDAQWWTRNLRRELCRRGDEAERSSSRVRRAVQCYVSDRAVQAKARAIKRNRDLLSQLEAVSETGQVVNLLDASDASVSNPKLRRGELMVRCRGFEEVANMLEHDAVFLTLTAPSRFHRFASSGKENPQWDGSTQRDGQAYLRGVFDKVRAEWARQGFHPYGFRVAEPHHDGCPHWHVLLFVPKHQAGWFNPERFAQAIANKKRRESAFTCAERFDAAAGVVGVAGAYALQQNAGERGALKHRFTVERIDRSKGSATGYIAKYICKNIDGEKEDGEGMGLDFASGRRAVEASKRVRGWASTHGIRQFQQIGGPSVTVWRELRRLAKDAEHPVCQLELFEGPRAAADRGLWSLFWFLQGGPDVARKDLTLRPMYLAAPVGRYGDEGQAVRGVRGREPGAEYEMIEITRRYSWTVQTAGQAAVDAAQAVHSKATRAAHDLGFPDVAAWERYLAEIVAGRNAEPDWIPDVERSGEAASTRTGVNNCTNDPDRAAIENDFLRGKGGQLTEETACPDASNSPQRSGNRPTAPPMRH